MTIKGNRSDCTATALILCAVAASLSLLVDWNRCCNESDMAIRHLKQSVSDWGGFRLCLCPGCWACWDDYKEPNTACFISIPSKRFIYIYFRYGGNFSWLSFLGTLMFEHTFEVLFSVRHTGVFCKNSVQMLVLTQLWEYHTCKCTGGENGDRLIKIFVQGFSPERTF